ncbi:hypothetical protein ACFXJ6_08130 [Streptomyces sp. NPDC059218]|uniref:hypothetical protein n=1 Tax=unclassified Streptomyces TaxID=2593676 RepID=UPI0036BAFBD3
MDQDHEQYYTGQPNSWAEYRDMERAENDRLDVVEDEQYLADNPPATPEPLVIVYDETE